MEAPTLYSLTLPPKFWYDHRSRDMVESPESHVERATGRAVYVRLTAHDVAGLLADAEFYGSPETAEELGRAYSGLCKSAATTRDRVRAAFDAATLAGWVAEYEAAQERRRAAWLAAKAAKAAAQ